MLPNTPRGYATSFPSRVGRVEVEPGEGSGPRRSWLPCLLACWSDRSGPRGRGQGCPFISALQCCTRHPLASSLNRRKEEAATGARGGVGVILGSRAWRLPRMAGAGSGGGLGPGNSEAPLKEVSGGGKRGYKLRPRWWGQTS